MVTMVGMVVMAVMVMMVMMVIMNIFVMVVVMVAMLIKDAMVFKVYNFSIVMDKSMEIMVIKGTMANIYFLLYDGYCGLKGFQGLLSASKSSLTRKVCEVIFLKSI
jgi:hypothetical protein